MRGRARLRCGGHHGDMRTPPPVPEPAATGPVAGVDDVVDAASVVADLVAGAEQAAAGLATRLGTGTGP